MDNENYRWTMDDMSRDLQVSNDTIYRCIEK